MVSRALIGVVVILGLGLGCTKEEGDGDLLGDESTGDSTGDSTTEGGDSTTTDGSETGEPVMCPETFPEFDKTCSLDSDCAVVLHMTDCCGTFVAWGITASEVEAFEAAETICESQYPGCGCAPQPTLAEDGNPVLDPATVLATCTMGACSSYVVMP